MNGRFAWMLAGGILLPTIILVALVVQATMQRQEWVDLRLAELQRGRAERTADLIADWIEARAGQVLTAVAAVTEGRTEDPGLQEELARLEARQPLARHLFLLNEEGLVLWPRLPVPSLSRMLAAQVAPTYPVLLNPLSLSRADAVVQRPGRQRYRQAIEVYRPLLRQSDPWLRLVAADLMARSYTQLQEWPQALEIYQSMAREYGRGIDAGGVPIELGVQFEIANIHYRMGEYDRFLDGYLTTYERLVDHDFALPEDQRRYLAKITRDALVTYFGSNPSAQTSMFERFEAVRRRQTAQLAREEFLRRLWNHDVGAAIAAQASAGTDHYLVLEVDGAPATFFWRQTAPYIVGFEVDPEALIDALRTQDLLRQRPEYRPVVRDLAGGRIAGGTQGQPVVWGGQVRPVPRWQVGVVPSGMASAGDKAGILYIWLAVLAVAGLGGGIFGWVRMVSGRLRTARLQADFVASVSHELRTPLTSIRLFCEMLLDGRARDDGERRTFLETIRRESQRLERVVQNVLSFAQSDRGAPVYDRSEVDLADLTARVVDSCAGVAQQKHVHLEMSADEGLPPVWADADRIESVVRDLLDNALRYGDGGAPVEIELGRRNGGVALHVADRGPGVPARERRRIFQPFFRGRQGLRQAKSGTGLGLALVKRIVEGHGGTVDVASRPGGGSVFTVVLPAVDAHRRE